MADPHVDKPGEIKWFKRYGPSEVLGPCPHRDCDHHSTAVIAWGPDMRRYTLEKCNVPDQCAGQCRAWHTEQPYKATTPWLHTPAV